MGSVESVFTVLELNPGTRIDQTIPTGTEIFLPNNPTNQRVVDYYELNNIEPSTGI
jgi:phage tail protein X